jgi:hypothetical protein
MAHWHTRTPNWHSRIVAQKDPQQSRLSGHSVWGSLGMSLESMSVLILTVFLHTFFFGFQGHHFIIATLPNPPYISEMIPVGFTADGSIKYTMTGLMPEVFDNLQVSACQSTNSQNQ